MNMILFDEVKKIIKIGSKSFSVATKLFNSSTRRSTLMLYAWCRYCDDFIDGQTFGLYGTQKIIKDAKLRIINLKIDTTRACNGEYMEEIAFQALQEVIIMHHLPLSLVFDHLEGFSMDVRNEHYFYFDDTLRYCYHVAGVVGLMMAYVMDIHEENILDRACDLGIAFQLTNIARDIIEDAENGRCYLPKIWLNEFGLTPELLIYPQYRNCLSLFATRLIVEAEFYYDSALQALVYLSFRSACAVATSCLFYRNIGIKVRNAGIFAWDIRQNTSLLEKFILILRGVSLAILSRFLSFKSIKTSFSRPIKLWNRPSI